MTEADLRSLVRDVLREALAQRRPSAPTPAPSPAPGGAPAAAEPVAIADDGDLAAFVRRVVALIDDPATGPAVRAGRHRFVLARPAVQAPAQAPTAAPAAVAVLEGTVTEARVARLANVRAVRLAPGAVLTPLARDRIRAMGLVIEGRR